MSHFINTRLFDKILRIMIWFISDAIIYSDADWDSRAYSISKLISLEKFKISTT